MMGCFFGHTPHFGFTTRWRIKKYRTFRLISGFVNNERAYRAHVCLKCGVRYFEIQRLDNVTVAALKARP